MTKALDVEDASLAVRLHCAVTRWPFGRRCLSCGWPFPCTVHQWGREVLVAAGWSDDDIARLDQRVGPWS